MANGLYSLTVATTLAIGPQEQIIKADATAAAFAVTMPDATKCLGQRVTLIKSDSTANAVTISRSGAQTFTGTGGAVTSLSLATQGKSYTLVSDGAGWLIVGLI